MDSLYCHVWKCVFLPLLSFEGFIESSVDNRRAHYWSSSLGSNDQDFRSEMRGTQLPAWVKFYSDDQSQTCCLHFVILLLEKWPLFYFGQRLTPRYLTDMKVERNVWRQPFSGLCCMMSCCTPASHGAFSTLPALNVEPLCSWQISSSFHCGPFLVCWGVGVFCYAPSAIYFYKLIAFQKIIKTLSFIIIDGALVYD